MTQFQNQLALITQAINLSKQLLVLAEKADWSRFQELEQQRVLLLDQLQLNELSVSEAEYGQLEQAMTSLMDLNTNLEQKCSGQRQEVMQELQKFRQSKKGLKAYSE